MRNLTTLAAQDPSRTRTLRAKFVGDIRQRVRALRGLLWDAIVVKDVLRAPKSVFLAAANPEDFVFKSDPEKVEEFMEWWIANEDEILLGIEARALRSGAPDARWTDTYVTNAYRRGLVRAQLELAAAGLSQNFDPDDTFALESAFQLPAHQRRAQILYQRVYGELKGITEAMDQQIRRILSDGVARGENPRTMASAMNKSIRTITNRRAVVMARTEVIRAHHQANIEEYRRAGVEGVMVKAEWITAGDERVCELCEPLHGEVFKLKEIEQMIPRHPQCRCVAVPISQEFNPDKFNGPELDADEAIELGESELNKSRKTPVAPGSTAPPGLRG